MAATGKKTTNKPVAKKKTNKKRRKKVARLSDQQPPDAEHRWRWIDARFSLVEVGHITGVRWQTVQNWMHRGHLDIGVLEQAGNKRLLSGLEAVQIRIIHELSMLGIPPKIWSSVSDFAVDSLRHMLHPSPWGRVDVFLYRDGDDWKMCLVHEDFPEDAKEVPPTAVRIDFDRLLLETRERIDELIQRQKSEAA